MKYKTNPYIRSAWNHMWDSDMIMERVIYDHEIIYIDKGKMKLTFDNEVYIADEGSCIIIPPKVHHKIESLENDTWQPHIHFDFFELPDSKKTPILLSLDDEIDPKYFRENFFEENNINIPYVIKLKNPLKIRMLMFDVIENFAQQKPYSELILKGLLINIVVAILDDYNSSLQKEYSQTENIYSLISYVISNINHNFRLDEMAAYAKTTPWNLIQSFNKLYNTTPKKFFDKYRLLHAKSLLEINNNSVKKIAYEMEFDAPQTFTRWFKKLDGKNPTWYKRKKNKDVK